MALLDHFAPNAGPAEEGGNGFERISSHAFTAVLSVAKEGVFGNATETLNRIRREFNLVASDDAQLNLIRVALSGKTTTGDESKFLTQIEKGLIAYETGRITTAELNTYLGL